MIAALPRKAAAVFVVRIDQQHARRVGGLQDLIEDKRDGARFAAAGRAQHGEVLLQQILHLERRLDARILREACRW